MMAASSLLIQESPLTVQPNLAVLIGLNEAIFLQQLQYWISREAGICDEYGRRWIYNTVKQWNVQFPFWSESTIKRTIKSLEDQEVMISTVIGNSYNKTKAYTINYELIEELSKKIVHKQFQASIESVDRRISAPPPMREKMEYTEEASAPDVMKQEYEVTDISEDGTEGQKVKTDEPRISVKMTLHEEQGEPYRSVKMTPQDSPPKSPITARDCVPPSRAHVTETTTTENTHRIHETTTGDVRSLCAALGIFNPSLERFIRRYGEEKVYEKARFLEIAMQTKTVRNPTGWLHSALKENYTFSPRSPQGEAPSEQTMPALSYVPPAPSSVLTEQNRTVKRNLREVLAHQIAVEGEGSAFAHEYLRRYGNPEGRSSP